MTDRIFDLLYKVKQREIVDRLRQQEMLNRNLSLVKSNKSSLRCGPKRIWQMLILRSERE